MDLNLKIRQNIIKELKLAFINSYLDEIENSNLHISKVKQQNTINNFNINIEQLINCTFKIQKKHTVNIDYLISNVNKRIGYNIFEKSRRIKVVRARQVLAYYLAKYYFYKPVEIAKELNQDRTTYVHSIKLIDDLINQEDLQTIYLYDLIKTIDNENINETPNEQPE